LIRQRHLLVVKPAEHDDGDVGRERLHPVDGLEALRVGEREVEQDACRAGREQPLPRRGDAVEVLKGEVARPRGAQHLAHEHGVARVVLDEDEARLVAFGVAARDAHLG
jgi:hypothetical protein